MHTAYLADHPEVLPTLARWHHSEWGHLHTGEMIPDRFAKLRERSGRAQIPTTLIALAGKRLLGSISLVVDDMRTRPDLSPWLASLYVAPQHRRRGIGSLLMARVVAEARRLGVDSLYLFTPDLESFYGARGWSRLETTDYRGEGVVVMARKIGSD